MRIVLEMVMFFALIGGVFYVNQTLAKERKQMKQLNPQQEKAS